MRLSDRPTLELGIHIDASPAAVWSVICDPALPVVHSEELAEAKWGDHPSGEPGVGSLIEGRNQRDDMGEWSTTSTVTEWQPNERITWEVGDLGNGAATWGFAIATEGEGVRLTQRYSPGPGLSGLSMIIEKIPDREADIIANRVEFVGAAMIRNLDAVKATAEAS